MRPFAIALALLLAVVVVHATPKGGDELLPMDMISKELNNKDIPVGDGFDNDDDSFTEEDFDLNENSDAYLMADNEEGDEDKEGTGIEALGEDSNDLVTENRRRSRPTWSAYRRLQRSNSYLRRRYSSLRRCYLRLRALYQKLRRTRSRSGNSAAKRRATYYLMRRVRSLIWSYSRRY